MEVINIFGQGCIGKFPKILNKTSYCNYPRSYITELSKTSCSKMFTYKKLSDYFVILLFMLI